MKLDHDPFPVNTVEFENKKVLIRPEQAESTKGKEVVIGEPRPKMIVPKGSEVGVWKENKSKASSSKTPKKPKVTFDMLLNKYEKRAEQYSNKGKRPRSPFRERFGPSSRSLESPFPYSPQVMPWGPCRMPPPGYLFPYFMPWGSPPPMYGSVPPMQFNQGWAEPRKSVHERLSSNKSRFQSRNRFGEVKREEKRIKVETRASDVITIKVESHEVLIPTEDEAKVVKDKETEDGVKTAQGESSTGVTGRSDRCHQAGLTVQQGRSDRRQTVVRPAHRGSPTGPYGRFDRRHSAGPTDARGRSDRFCPESSGASSSSGKIYNGNYIAPGTKPNSRWIPENLTASQKRRLQRLRAQELREKKAEEWRDRRFNRLRPPPSKEWRPKSPKEVEELVIDQE